MKQLKLYKPGEEVWIIDCGMVIKGRIEGFTINGYTVEYFRPGDEAEMQATGAFSWDQVFGSSDDAISFLAPQTWATG